MESCSGILHSASKETDSIQWSEFYSRGKYQVNTSTFFTIFKLQENERREVS